ncbi:MAG: hypothetical protein AAGC65_24650 [Mucilaginibacter sp.]|uniref:hypothetical protein n=1 Tax=Mucilaginibacter sp. TaxID=1882438 RepID=UPI0031AEDD37
MTALPLKLNRNIILITLIALIIFIGGLLLLHSVAYQIKDKVASGLLADFVITFPVLYYLIMVRPLKLPLKRMLLVISICSAVAYLVLPAHQREYILQLRKLTAAAEILFIIYTVSQIRKLNAFYKTHQATLPDPIYNLRAAMAHVLGDSLPVKLIASELAVLRYGLLCWRKEKSSLKVLHNFSTHKETGYIAIWCILMVVVLVELVAFHLLLLRWSPIAAIIATGLSLYSMILFVADLSAILKRKIQLMDTHLLLRTGLRWRIYTSINNVASVKKITNDYSSEDAYFKGGIIKSGGNLLINFKEPVQIDRLYGASRTLSTVLMNIDDYEAFAEALNAQKENSI